MTKAKSVAFYATERSAISLGDWCFDTGVPRRITACTLSWANWDEQVGELLIAKLHVQNERTQN